MSGESPERVASRTGDDELRAAFKAWEKFKVARQHMNDARPDVMATPAERGLYDERYKADHEAEREHWRSAISLAQAAGDILASTTAMGEALVEAEARGYAEAVAEIAEMARNLPHLVKPIFVPGIEGLPLTRDANRAARSIHVSEAKA